MRLLAVVLVSLSAVCLGQLSFPANEYEFSVRRDLLKAAERVFQRTTTTLSEDERTVDHYLQHLKWLEFKRTEDTGFPPARPIEEEMDHIRSTDVYRVLKKLPKGGNMHTHENHQLSKRTFLELVWNSTQLQYLYMVDPTQNTTASWTLDFFSSPPENQGWIHVNSSQYTLEEIYQHQILIGIMDSNAKKYPSDSGERWRQMDVLWGRMASIIANLPIKLLYLKALYDSSLEENVQYIEARKNFDPPEYLYVIDESPAYNATHGKRFLNNEQGDLEVNITLGLVDAYMREHPEFIGHKRITYAVRALREEDVNATLQNAARLHRAFPQHVVGADLVAEEDSGNSHLFFLRSVLSLHDGGSSAVPLRMHTAETNWPDDLITSNDNLDPVATIQNIYESILYGAKRIGHGLGFIKHPYLLNILRANNIAIESCPVSNQVLGFIPDVRNHPALHYLRSGVPVVLGSDDPGTFGYDYFTIDWYEIFMSWGLDLTELKQLATNALQYSSMTEEEKQEALQGKWQTAWEKFVNETKIEACSFDYSEYEPLFGMVLPREGANTGTTHVHIYGRNFTRGICHQVRCRFGEHDSPTALYISNNHIICEAPDISVSARRLYTDLSDPVSAALRVRHLIADTTVPIYVDLGDGNYTYVGQDFTYKYASIFPPPTTTAEQPDDSGACRVSSPMMLVVQILIICIGICNLRH